MSATQSIIPRYLNYAATNFYPALQIKILGEYIANAGLIFMINVFRTGKNIFTDYS